MTGMNQINTRTDILTHLADVRSDLDDTQRDTVTDQIQLSDHPAWGTDWAGWLDEELPAVVERALAPAPRTDADVLGDLQCDLIRVLDTLRRLRPATPGGRALCAAAMQAIYGANDRLGSARAAEGDEAARST